MEIYLYGNTDNINPILEFVSVFEEKCADYYSYFEKVVTTHTIALSLSL